MNHSKYLVEFDSIDWELIAEGVAEKCIVQNNQKLRLVEFSSGFFEENWCSKGHIGYVLSGQMNLHFRDEIVHFKLGNALWIEAGIANEHKMRLIDNQTVCLLLFESLTD